MFNHVFRYFGIPEDIVSDRGPQFISRVWKNFLKLLGVTVYRLGSTRRPTGSRRERSRKLVNLLPWPPALLEPVYWLGRVCPELPLSTNHWTHSLPVHARFPATFVPLGRGTIRFTCIRSLVLRGSGTKHITIFDELWAVAN